MQQKGSQTTWIVCGVIALVVICGGGFLLFGGLGLLAYIGGQSTPTPETVKKLPEATRPPALPTTSRSAAPASTVSAGENAGIPYKAVVQIIAFVKLEDKIEPAWTGSGSIISPDGLVLTNAHVVLSDRYYEVEYLVVALTQKPDEQPVPTYIAKVMQADQQLDIAVIRVESDLKGNPVDRGSLNLPTVQMGNSEALSLGDPLTIIGYPSIGGSTITLTRGEVAGFTAEKTYGNRAFIKTSATISGGNSGGLAADANGMIIGIPTQLGYGGDDQYVDCRRLVDTNRDNVVDEKDNCVPAGGFINALRPLKLAQPLIDAAKRGEVDIKEGVESAQGQVPAPTEEPSKIVYQDDFSDPNSGWQEKTWEAGEVAYRKGEYQVNIQKENWLVWSNLDTDMDNLGIAVDTRVVKATGEGDYGVICRYQDEDNFYGLEISEDGYFSIWKRENGEMVTLNEWTASNLIVADRSLRVMAACVNNHLMLGVDGELLADVTDDSFKSGKFGMLVGTFDTGDLTIAFDNFTVYEP